MEVNVATSFHCSARHTVFPQCPSPSQTLASSQRCHLRLGGKDITGGGSLLCHYPVWPISNSNEFLGAQSSKLHRSKSCELWKFSKATASKKMKSMQKHNPIRRVCSASSDFFSDEEFSNKIHELSRKFKISGEEEAGSKSQAEIIHESVKLTHESVTGVDSMEPPWPKAVNNHSSILRKASSEPHSLRVIKRKLQEEAPKEASESTHNSVNKAFNSMVFMMEELHSFTLQTREPILHEDLHAILHHFQKDMHMSFLWLFQRVFSQTPTLMVSIMIMLANFTVHSMESNIIINEMVETYQGSSLSLYELGVWKSMVEEAERMQDIPVDRETRMRFVSPIEAKMEDEEYDDDDHVRRDVLYQMYLREEPNNPLLLANYAQFLYLVTRDYERAGEYFERATKGDEQDAEAYYKRGNFMWRVREDVWAAEENFVEAISVDPTNTFYAAHYAHFLWNTGGADDTCFLL